MPPFRAVCNAPLRVNPEQASAFFRGVEGLTFLWEYLHFCTLCHALVFFALLQFEDYICFALFNGRIILRNL